MLQSLYQSICVVFETTDLAVARLLNPRNQLSRNQQLKTIQMFKTAALDFKAIKAYCPTLEYQRPFFCFHHI